MDKFCHLHGHGEYSSLDGACKIPELVKRVAEIEQSAIALTDHGNINGAYKFYSTCKKNGIKPILGAELYMCEDVAQKSKNNHITILCQNQTGWNNLVQLNKIASQQVYYKPRVDFNNLREYSEGLICLSGCLAGICSRNIVQGYPEKAKKHIEHFLDIFGDRFFIEIMDHGIEDQHIANQALRAFAQEYNIKRVGTNDFHYINREDAELQDILLCDQIKADIDDPNRMKMSCDEFYIKTREEMNIEPEEADMTLEIADMCDVNFERKRFFLPSKRTDYSSLLKLVQKGIEDKKIGKDLYESIYAPRLRLELKVIKDAGLMGYFLTVADYVGYARAQNILVGPGRGSVGGCLVAYLLGIHDIDPIKYDLLFSRFYNEGRKGSLPDIDIDFPEKSVNKIIDYVSNKYGKEHVAHIGTYMRLGLKGAIKLVCRVIKRNGEIIPQSMANFYSDTVEDPGATDLLEVKDPFFKKVLAKARKFVNLATHQSIHAAGIIIADCPIKDVAPIIWDKKSETYLTAWDMRDIEDMGLVKFDFLSLTTLDVIQDVLKAMGIELNSIPFNDKEVFKLISTTDNVGVFQLSSGGISQLANLMMPRNIEDIAVIVALFRPGPLGSGLHMKYVKRRFGEEPIEYLHEKLKPILKDTYGLMVYQEQVIRICMDLAGFSEVEADSIRKGIGKKIPEILEKLENQFIEGCVKNDVDESIAKILWDQIEEFCGYSFNRSHAVAYATITYYTAYLKAHYPVEFMIATMNNSYSEREKLEKYLKDCVKMGIEILPPSINKSTSGFSSSDGKILFGLKAITGVGETKANEIIMYNYSDYNDFVFSARPPKDTLEALIEAGYFDDMGYNRNQLLKTVDDLIPLLKKKHKHNPKARTLFDTKPKIDIPDVKEMKTTQLAAKEFDRLNMFIVFNPIEGRDMFFPLDLIGKFKVDIFLQSCKTIITKRTKSTMAIGNALTSNGIYEILFFPKMYKDNQARIKQGNILRIHAEFKEGKFVAKGIE